MTFRSETYFCKYRSPGLHDRMPWKDATLGNRRDGSDIKMVFMLGNEKRGEFLLSLASAKSLVGRLQHTITLCEKARKQRKTARKGIPSGPKA